MRRGERRGREAEREGGEKVPSLFAGAVAVEPAGCINRLATSFTEKNKIKYKKKTLIIKNKHKTIKENVI